MASNNEVLKPRMSNDEVAQQKPRMSNNALPTTLKPRMSDDNESYINRSTNQAITKTRREPVFDFEKFGNFRSSSSEKLEIPKSKTSNSSGQPSYKIDTLQRDHDNIKKLSKE